MMSDNYNPGAGLFETEEKKDYEPATIFIDCETGGTSPKTNALIQIAAIVEVDGVEVDSIELKMQPFAGKTVDDGAIKTHGMTIEEITGFMESIEAYKKFYLFLQWWGDPRRRKDKRLVVAGFNSGFDIGFIFEWFKDCSGGPYKFWDYLQFKPIDLLPIFTLLQHVKLIEVDNVKLSTLCAYFGIEMKAHNALEDIRATRELLYRLCDRLKSGWLKKNDEQTDLLKQ